MRQETLFHIHVFLLLLLATFFAKDFLTPALVPEETVVCGKRHHMGTLKGSAAASSGHDPSSPAANIAPELIAVALGPDMQSSSVTKKKEELQGRRCVLFVAVSCMHVITL